MQCALPCGTFALCSPPNDSEEYCKSPSLMVWGTAWPLLQPLMVSGMMTKIPSGMEKVVQFGIPSEGDIPAEKPNVCPQATQEWIPMPVQFIQTINVPICIKQGTQTE